MAVFAVLGGVGALAQFVFGLQDGLAFGLVAGLGVSAFMMSRAPT